MDQNKVQTRFGIVAIMVVFAALSRLLPHPYNFTPIGGMALFGAAYFTKKFCVFFIPLLAFWLSDLILNNVVYTAYFEGFQWASISFLFVSISFIAIALFGIIWLKKVTSGKLIAASLIASIIFFLVTNFGSWLIDPMAIYPKTPTGLAAAYAAGIPFFWNTLLGDLFYTAVLFGTHEWVNRKYFSTRSIHA
jgi:hypothetical protein